MPGTDRTTDPWIHELGSMRTTHLHFADGRRETITDDKDARCVLPEEWNCETKFQIIKKETTRDTTPMIVDHSFDSDMETTSSMPSLVPPPVGWQYLQGGCAKD